MVIHIKRLLPLLILLIAVVVVIATDNPISNGVQQIGATKNKIVCDVTVENKILAAMDIKSYSCHVASKCNGFLSIAPMSIFGFTADNGYVYLEDNNLVAGGKEKVSIEEPIIEPPTKEYSVSICTASTNIRVRLDDDKGNQLDTKSWSVS